MLSTLLMMCIGEAAAARATEINAKDSTVITDAVDQGSDRIVWSEHSASDLAGASIKTLLNLQFSEPLPTVISRAKKTAEVMDIGEALSHVGKGIPQEIRKLIQGNMSLIQGKSQFRDRTKPKDVFATAMAFLNHEYNLVREKIDVKLFECGFFKIVKEKEIQETEDRLSSISQDMALASAVIDRALAERETLEGMISKKREMLREHLNTCKSIRSEIEADRATIQQDYSMIKIIIEVTMKECAKKEQRILNTGLHFWEGR
jgi:hypothetical protein